MATTTDRRRRSRLMRLMRLSPGPLLVMCLAGGALMGYAAAAPPAGDRGQLLWDAGVSLLAVGGALFAALLWGGVYLNVVEASRGMPGLRPVAEPAMEPGPAAELAALKRALAGLGFRPDGWFSLDDFEGAHVLGWTHAERPAAAFVMYSPTGRTFRVGFVRRFASGGVLVSSTRVTDLAVAPPQGVYLQARSAASVEELWAWHLEAEALFPAGEPAAEARAGGAREMYVDLYARWARHIRRDRTWLLAVEPVEECWRMYWLRGMPLQEQFERGWTTPFWR